MRRKLVVAAIFASGLLLLLAKHYIFVNVLGDDSLETAFTDVIIVMIVTSSAAFGYWMRSGKRVSDKPSNSLIKQNKVDFYTIPIALSVFALYILLFVMRLIIFINMYAEKPFLLMLEFPIIAIVAIILFIPFVIKRINLDDTDDDDDETESQ